MTQRLDSELILRRWFEDGPSSMPDRVVTVVADRISRQRQRRGLWRFRVDLNRRFVRVAIMAAALLAAAAVGLWLIGRTPSTIPVPERSPNPSVSPSVSPSATPAAAVFHAGDYGFQVPFSIVLGAWSPVRQDLGAVEVSFLRTGVGELSFMSLANTHYLWREDIPTWAAMHPWPADIEAWLRARAGDDLTASTAVIGGRAATVLDLACPTPVTPETCNFQFSTATGPTVGMGGGVGGPSLHLVEIRTAPGEGLIVGFPDASLVDEVLSTLQFE